MRIKTCVLCNPLDVAGALSLLSTLEGSTTIPYPYLSARWLLWAPQASSFWRLQTTRSRRRVEWTLLASRVTRPLVGAGYVLTMALAPTKSDGVGCAGCNS